MGLRVWFRLGLIVERLMREACPSGCTLTECQVLSVLPRPVQAGSVQAAVRPADIARKTGVPLQTVKANLTELARRELLVRQRTGSHLTESGARLVQGYMARLRAIEFPLRPLYLAADEDSARRVCAVLEAIEQHGLQPKISPTSGTADSRPQLISNWERTAFLMKNSRRQRPRFKIETVIMSDDTGPFLRLSAQALEGTGLSVGTLVRLTPEAGSLMVRTVAD